MWLEGSGYIGARRAFTAGGARLVPAPVDSERLDLDARVEVDPTLRQIFVSPSQQCPLGVTMSLAGRRLLEVAEHTGAWVIENDYNWELCYAG